MCPIIGNYLYLKNLFRHCLQARVHLDINIFGGDKTLSSHYINKTLLQAHCWLEDNVFDWMVMASEPEQPPSPAEEEERLLGRLQLEGEEEGTVGGGEAVLSRLSPCVSVSVSRHLAQVTSLSLVQHHKYARYIALCMGRMCRYYVDIM